MNKMQMQVRDFCKKIDQPTAASPRFSDVALNRLRARLIAEEAAETVVALLGRQEASEVLAEYLSKVETGGKTSPDLVDAVDGICDLVYVALGAAEAIGIDLEPHFDAVHEANMAKQNAPVDEHGKRGAKPAGWSPPDAKHRALLANPSLSSLCERHDFVRKPYATCTKCGVVLT